MNKIQDYYQNMILTSLAAILERSARPESNGFINTKLSLFTGLDFPASDPVRGAATIYSWIQGRGLEALAVHYKWLKNDDSVESELADELSQSCLVQLSKTLEVMENIRQANSGRLLFMHDAKTAKPVKINQADQVVEAELDVAGPATMSELFYVKGLAAAADVIGDKDKLEQACQWYAKIHEDIVADKFINDQQPLDPKNVAAKPVEGRMSHGPRMIALGAAFRFLELTGDKVYLDYGLEYLDYILANHINLGDADSPGEKYDMWEFTDLNRQPYFDDAGQLLSDSGHATEFTGLAGKLLMVAQNKGLNDCIVNFAEYKKLLPAILKKNFDNGFSKDGYGIAKAVDLVSRKPINDAMPWWPLPETMRSACLLRYYASPEAQSTGEQIFTKCSDAFVKYFVREDLHMMAYQTIDAGGKAIDVIPATPDADPGYHTNLSIIDCL